MGRKRRGVPVHGWLNIDKAVGPSSAHIVAAVLRITGAAKAGHGGTLDPLADGVLPIALGEATKTTRWVMDGSKTYRFTARWGETTNTDDGEGVITTRSENRPDRAEILAVLPAFIGTISQIPPAYSAIKVNGERAYAAARAGEAVELAPREVVIDDLRLIETPDDDHAVFEVDCGKGTYVRAIARDLGARLGCGAHVTALRRTRVGHFMEDTAISLDELAAMMENSAGSAPGETLAPCLLPIQTALADIPALAIGDREARRLRDGQPVSLLRKADRDRIGSLSDLGPDGLALALDGDRPAAITRVDGGLLHPVRVLNT